MRAPQKVDWYFDYVSPFAYLQRHRLDEVAAVAEIVYHPVLFAGLLRKWEHKGPAEIPGKRILTFRHAKWLAAKMGVPYKLPKHHPFNPLKVLRLTVALGCIATVVKTIFDSIWIDGLMPDDPDGWRAILKNLGIQDAKGLLADPSVKSVLQENGNRALENDLFGVPTFVANGHLFWGLDTDYLSNPNFFEDPEMKRILSVNPSTTRRSH